MTGARRNAAEGTPYDFFLLVQAELDEGTRCVLEGLQLALGGVARRHPDVATPVAVEVPDPLLPVRLPRAGVLRRA
ncbi:MAG: hypothetical protein M5R42_16255, partial [Rhodocyclaceae bacterium]|nr:hypothetical protein [Rhodocyclaceae bacterium]